jgi:hypothetical protein
MGAIIRSPNSLPCNERRIAISRDCFLDRISQLLKLDRAGRGTSHHGFSACGSAGVAGEPIAPIIRVIPRDPSRLMD